MRAPASFAILLVLALGACDEPRPREQKLNPRPEPLSAELITPPARSAEGAEARAGAFGWDAEAGVFLQGEARLQAGRLWTFDGSTDGFVLAGGQVGPAEPAGLAVALTAFDPILRSPSGLALDGGRYSLVLVRLTRVARGSAWDGSLYYSTADHGESAGYTATPFQGADPAVNETVILAYDMRQPRAGGADWSTSLIDQIRLDLDDEAGGEFIIHQIAVAEPPADTPPPSLRPAS